MSCGCEPQVSLICGCMHACIHVQVTGWKGTPAKHHDLVTRELPHDAVNRPRTQVCRYAFFFHSGHHMSLIPRSCIHCFLQYKAGSEDPMPKGLGIYCCTHNSMVLPLGYHTRVTQPGLTHSHTLDHAPADVGGLC
jgi:hypothetical protein